MTSEAQKPQQPQQPPQPVACLSSAPDDWSGRRLVCVAPRGHCGPHQWAVECHGEHPGFEV